MYRFRCLVTRVLDADTVDCCVDLGFRMTTKQRLRLSGIQAPELNTPEGVIAKECVEDLLKSVDYRVQIQTEKTGSFGRWLAVIYLDGHVESLNDMLLKNGIAVPYKR